MLEVCEINQPEALSDWRASWEALLARTPSASFFQSLPWLECYWKHFGADQKLRVLIVAKDGQATGILPLVVRAESTRVGRLRMLTYPLHDWATFFGPIGPDPLSTLVAALRHVEQTPRDWDVIDFRWVDAEGADQGRTPQAMAQAGFRPCRQKWDRTALVELPDTWDDYWQGREAKFRKNIDRLQRRMAEEGNVELVRFRPGPSCGNEGDPCWDLYDTCVALAQRSWQGESGDRTNLCHEEVGAFFRDAHAAAARLGAVDGNVLYFNGEPTAFAYNYHWQGSVFGLRRGFDPRFKHLRSGLVLQKLMLEDGHRRGDRCYDLGTGSHDTKQAWRTRLKNSYRFTFFSPLVLRAQLLRCNRWLLRCLRGEQDIACSS